MTTLTGLALLAGIFGLVVLMAKGILVLLFRLTAASWQDKD